MLAWAGTTVMLLPGAANRDPAHFACPPELRLDRPSARQNVGFARGVRGYPDGPLARIGGRAVVERILFRFSDIRLGESRRGPPDDRRLDCAPPHIRRGLQAPHLKFVATA